MIETLTALVFAHVLADFVLQTNWINQNKARPHVLALHGLIVAATAIAVLGQTAFLQVGVLTAAHLAIDAAKTYGRFRGLTAFLVDQSAHFATLVAIAVWAPGLWTGGLWAAQGWILPVMLLFSGLIIATRAGGFAIGFLMLPHSLRIRNQGLKNGGRLIGILERGLIFILILLGQPLGVGFLIGAKSILRFGTASRDQRTAEYVIIGTLASFGWAIIVSYGTLGWMTLVPDLSLPPPP